VSGFSEYSNFDGLGLAELVANGDVTPRDLLDEAISRTEEVNPKLNAVTTKLYDHAEKQIKAGLPDGPFKGVPYLLKDLHLLVKGTVTTSGSRAFVDNVADHDSTLVERYKKAGLVLFGKTNTPEFGLTTTTEPALFGPSRNPWNPEHSPGGSSGGAGAAVAARVVPMANASDGGGSIRIPASANGVFGLKPSRARTPQGPDRFDGWNGLSISHAVSLSVRDNAALLDATTGPAPGDLYYPPRQDASFLTEVTTDPGPLKIAFSTKTPSGTPIDPECQKAVEQAAKLCAELGHQVEESDLEYNAAELGQSMLTFMTADIAYTLEARAEQLGRPLRDDEVELQTRRMQEMGMAQGPTDYAKAKYAFQKYVRGLAPFFQSHDVFIQPVLAQPPVPIGYIDTMAEDFDAYIERVMTYSPYTSLYNMTGQPSMSVPLHWTPGGLPVGTMFTSRYGADGILFRLAGHLEKARPWFGKKPSICA
jgi:amidase/6-aminohexanoate-cyclic-dimer hydrolase